MQITRSSIDTQKGPADWFTGDVYVDPVAAPAGRSPRASARWSWWRARWLAAGGVGWIDARRRY